MKKYCLTAIFILLLPFAVYGQDNTGDAGTVGTNSKEQVDVDGGQQGGVQKDAASVTQNKNEQTGVNTPARVEPKGPVVNRKTQPKEQPKRADQTREENKSTDKADDNNEQEEFADNGLLHVGEGNFIIKRIPEIVVETRKISAEESIVTVEEQVEEDQPVDDDSYSSLSIVAILIFIIIIIMLYNKMRPRVSSRRKVVRTFPKK